MLVAGVDSSTQATKVVVRDVRTWALRRAGRAPHPPGTEVDPESWWRALLEAFDQAGGLDDVAAVGVAGQQHGLVCLDEGGAVIRPALLWHDTRAASAAAELVDEVGPARWAASMGSVPVASFTVAKLRWLATHEPEHAGRVAAICLPHDWLTWRLAGRRSLGELVTDRGDASGTGYFSPAENRYLPELIERALGHVPALPEVLGSHEVVGQSAEGAAVAAGTGDNMAAALGLSARPGDVIVSVGTSGVVSALSATPSADPTGAVAGFADATGHYLPLVCTLNATGILSAAARLLGVDLDELSTLALEAPPGAGGLVLLPYLAGERTPNLPAATASLLGLTEETARPPHVARAFVEGLLCGLRQALDALVTRGKVAFTGRLLLTGGGARSSALSQLAPEVFEHAVTVRATDEPVADGAARLALWALSGGGTPPPVPEGPSVTHEPPRRSPALDRYRDAGSLFLPRAFEAPSC